MDVQRKSFFRQYQCKCQHIILIPSYWENLFSCYFSRACSLQTIRSMERRRRLFSQHNSANNSNPFYCTYSQGIVREYFIKIEELVERTSMLRHMILKKIISLPSVQLRCFFIGLNESSHQELFNQSICLEKFQIFQKLSWKN